MDGTSVVYRAPVVISLDSSFVNVTLEQQTVNGQTIMVPTPGVHVQPANNVYVGSAS